MTAVFGIVILAVCALIATASWSVEAAAHLLVDREHAVVLATWGGLCALAAVVTLATGDDEQPVVLVLLALAAVAAVIGVAGAVGLATPATRLGEAAAEACLVAASLVSILWVVAGAPSSPGPRGFVWITLTTVDVTTAALVVRVPVVSPDVSVDHRYRPAVAVGVAALGCLGLGDGLMTLHHLGLGVSAGAGLTLRGVAYLIAAAVPWVPEGRSRPARPAGLAVRSLPYLLVGLAVVALVAAAVAGRAGPVSLVLVALVVCGLAAVQAVGLREKARLLRDLASSRHRLIALVENATDVILGIDTLGRVESANAAAARLLHRAPEEMTGVDIGELAVAEDRATLRRTVDDVVHGRWPAARIELRLAPPATGSAELRLRSVPGGAVANMSDTTEAVELRGRLERLARYDELTGLANRSHLLGEISAWLRCGWPVAVLYCDLDGFKAVNDRFGHLCGDVVLAQAAHRFRQVAEGLVADGLVADGLVADGLVADGLVAEGSAAGSILVARIGGDEFVVALVRPVEAEVAAAADRLLAAMRPTFAVADRAVRVGLSIGVAASADVPSADDLLHRADDLLHRADVAMFAAKQAGRFRSVRWDAAIQARALRRVDIAIGLRHALDSDRLALAYQPLVRLSDGAVVGVEALLRVSPEDDGPGALAGLPDLVSPAELVAVAEDTGEIIEMGHWVLVEATRQAARWRELGHELFTTVNVSVRQLAAEGFVDSVGQALETAGLSPSGLVVEITEGQALAEGDPAWTAVERLRSMGVMLVIDDFGSGYSSLAYLPRMPVRGVKLDRALLEGLTTDPRARTLARAVIAAARALGFLVVAEGLESLHAARIVRDLGAYAGQGFALYGAMPPDEITQVLARPPRGLGSTAGTRLIDLTQRRARDAAPADLT